jgi:3-keto-disaccharide hydrolase
MIRYAGLLILGFVLAAPRARAQDSGWQQLFNGKDLTSWEHVGPGSFAVKDGLLVSHGGMGLLWYTGQKFGNVTIRVVFKTIRNTSNSGVFIRIPEKPTEPWMPVNRGIEVQIDNSDDDYHCTGVLYSMTKAMARPQKPPGEWNTMDITIEGPRTLVTLNGIKITDYTEGQPVPPKKEVWEPDRGRRPDEGYIGLQNHSDKDAVIFKEVAFKPLSNSE